MDMITFRDAAPGPLQELVVAQVLSLGVVHGPRYGG
jgi:hypothetical protein